jgi:hypothetical protein
LLVLFLGCVTVLSAWNTVRDKSTSPHQWQLSYRSAFPILLAALIACAILLVVQWAIPGDRRLLSLRRMLTVLLALDLLYLGILVVASGVSALRGSADTVQVAMGGTSITDLVTGVIAVLGALAAGVRVLRVARPA